MGACVFCGKSAGLFRSRHSACAAIENERLAAMDAQRRAADIERDRLMRELQQEAFDTLHTGADLRTVEARVLDAIAAGKIDHTHRRKLLVAAWLQGVERFLDDSVLEAHEEHLLVTYQNHFGLSMEDLNQTGTYSRLAKSSVLRRVLAGELEDFAQTGNFAGVNFERGEVAVWSFQDVQHLEDVERRQVVGRSQGVSVRVMRGVYYRVGGFKGESVVTTERKDLGTGTLIATNINLYFIGERKTTKIPYRKVVSYTPYSNGIGLVRDTLTAKPQIFIIDDGWFAFNLVSNLSSLRCQR